MGRQLEERVLELAGKLGSIGSKVQEYEVQGTQLRQLIDQNRGKCDSSVEMVKKLLQTNIAMVKETQVKLVQEMTEGISTVDKKIDGHKV